MNFKFLLGAASVAAVVCGFAPDVAAQASLPQVTVDAPTQRPRAQPTRTVRPSAQVARRAVRAGPQRTRTTAPVVSQQNVGAPAASQPSPGSVGKVVVSQSVTAQPANSTVITGEEIRQRPVTSYGDIFRPVAGFNISNYNQGIIGYGLTLRGFNDGEHGRDVAYFIDGVPINEVSSQHTPNYADLNPLIPETIERVDIVRGPFSVEYGDSNLGGSVNIITKRAEPFATVGVSGGSFSTGRAVGTYSRTSGTVLPFAAFEAYRTGGYAQNSDVSRYNAFLKSTFLLEGGAELSVRAQAYKADGGAPGYISRDQLLRGLISDTTMQNLVANYRIGPAGQELDATLYVNHDKFDRWSDFGGGQRAQLNERNTTGATIKKLWTTSISGMPTQFLIGGNWRTDFIDAVQERSIARNPFPGTVSRNLGIRQTNLAGFSQIQVKPTEWLKLTGGVRVDQFFYDVTNNLTPAISPTASPSVVSPKAGISITPVKWAEIFANYGQGFRSPSAVDDLATLATAKPTKLTSKEIGARLLFERVTLSASLWRTDNSNEMFQAAPGLPVVSLGQSHKQGVDLEAKVTAYQDEAQKLAFFANYSPLQAKLLNAGASIYVPSVPQSLLNLGVDYDMRVGNGDKLTASAYVTFVGKKYLSQDGAQTTKPYSRISAKAGYEWQSGWSAFAQATYYPGDLYGEAAFNFGDNVGALPADIFVRPVPRLTLMAGATYKFGTSAASSVMQSARITK